MDGVEVGVVAPSTFYTLDNGQIVINGPDGVIKLNEQTIPALTEGLQRSGSLVSGTPAEIQAVCKLLKNPETSRTTSFFLCKAENCAHILEDINAIQSAKILLVGCGGIGSSVALLLAGSGIKNFTFIDSDVIERSNLNRQLFWRKKDIGEYKVDILARELNDRFDGLDILTFKKELDFDGIVEHSGEVCYSAIVITADNPPTLVSRSEELASKVRIPVLSGGYLHSNCVANFFSGKDNDNILYNDELKTPWERLPDSIMPSFGPLNFNIAALLSSGVIAFIASRVFGSHRSSYIEWDAASIPCKYVAKYYYE